MANQFGGNPGECISWSNGLTSVLLARIAVAAAELFRTKWQRDFARWVATFDQNRGPPGCVSFDLFDIPWGDTLEDTVANQQFVVEVVVHAASQEVAYRLPYYPNPDREVGHREYLREFALMVRRFDRSHFAEEWPHGWKWYFPPADALCPHHGLFVHAGGCMVFPDSQSARPGA